MSDRRFLAKVILVGRHGVGKTSLIQSYLHGEIRSDYKATIGLDIYRTEVEVGGVTFFLQLWDLSGQTHFQDIRKRFYKGASAAILVFDQSQAEESLDSLAKVWAPEVLPLTVPLMVAGNKSDLTPADGPEQTLLGELVAGFCRSYPLDPLTDVVGTSAKDGTNVKHLFTRMAEKILTQRSWQM